MKTCIINGASRGIGRAIAIELSRGEDIDRFILIARDAERLHETKALMNKEQKQIDIYPVDLADIAATEQAYQSIARDYESIDILINCAGYAEPKSLLETSIENWENTYRVNVTSMFIAIKEVVRVMKKTGGKILNVASTAGMGSRPGWLAYASSKAAVISMSDTLSDELKEYGIKVYCVSPGRCATDLRKILAPDEDPSTIMQPEHVANVVKNLLSESGDCLDGQNIVIRKQIFL